MKTKCFFARVYAGGRGVKIFGLLCSMLLLVASGCGYDVTETTTYHAANWTSDGKIIARRLTLRHGKNLISNSIPLDGSEEIVVMNADGSGEQGLFSVDENIIKLIEMSPLGNYVGYINGNGVLKVYTRGGALVGSVTLDLDTDSTAQILDFNPDESKVYVSIGYGGMLVYSIPNLELEEKNFIGGGGGVRTASTLVIVDKTARKTAIYNLDTKNIQLLSAEMTPEYYLSDTDRIATLGVSEVYFYSLSDNSYTSTSFSWSPYSANDFTGKHFSGDGGRLVMSWRGAEADGIGVYTLDTATSEIRQIR